jgi:hypothetical protein
VGEADSKVKESFAGISVLSVLFNGVFDVLTGEGVFKFGGEEGQTVEEEGKVKALGGVFLAVV